MKKLIKRECCQTITIEQLQGLEIVAYKCLSSDNICILARIDNDNDFNTNYGFVPFGQSNSTARYRASLWKDAINLASKQRAIIIFSNTKELANFILNPNKFG